MKKTVICVFGALVLGACSAPMPMPTSDNVMAAIGAEEFVPKCVARGLSTPTRAASFLRFQRKYVINRADPETLEKGRAEFQKRRAGASTKDPEFYDFCAMVEIEGS